MILALLAFMVRPLHAEPVPINDRWADLRFLIGEWDTEPTKSVKSGNFSLTEDLGGAVLIRRNHAEYAPKPGEEQGLAHDDLMIVYTEDGKHRATFVDPEGHVIHYSILSSKGSATFESDAVPGAPRYKLVYERENEDRVSVKFFIAPPGGGYELYVSGRVKRRGHS
ncbi:MAG TPA: hypothetical protein VFD83_01865 [Candidatus Polarisedimenticolia bacterium]|nr:hypothetical protein [Candidatus Polarisedimenticolia bacterium]